MGLVARILREGISERSEGMTLIVKRYDDLSSPFLFYKNTVALRFSKKAWAYFRVVPNGLTPVEGVTSTCHILDHSAPLMVWAVNRALERVRTKMAEHRRLDGSYELYSAELEAILESAKKADKEALEDAGEVGHVAHAWIEQYIKSVLAGDTGRQQELLAKLPEDERASNCCIAFVVWSANHNVRWISTEQKVYSLEHNYAGTLDATALVDSCSDPACCDTFFRDQLSICDHKTSNYLHTEYLLQTAAYQHAEEEESGLKYDARWIIRYGKTDAEFDAWYVPGREGYEQDFAAFLNCLRLNLSIREIEARMDTVKDARTATKKALELAAKLASWKIECPKFPAYKGTRLSKCLPSGEQCDACKAKYEGSSTLHLRRDCDKVLAEPRMRTPNAPCLRARLTSWLGRFPRRSYAGATSPITHLVSQRR
jgi:hypothetical protein